MMSKIHKIFFNNIKKSIYGSKNKYFITLKMLINNLFI
ncbi:hypothetical protein BGAPBR_H0014 (plasmid) [Borreliella garinii PBr]|uniref:Uncharacterized protein n=1 Tax=Borreliella garinii PBr TaxID=498743 RepID=B8F1G6_BORGR|nr:hypothetical protein BGAPBR_H0014 [Borreliella garinii PBr]